MRISKLKLVASSVILASSIGAFSVFAHEGGDGGMMSPEGMEGMEGMMDMMSEMAPEDRKAMTKACMNMMQGHSMKDGDEAE